MDRERLGMRAIVGGLLGPALLLTCLSCDREEPEIPVPQVATPQGPVLREISGPQVLPRAKWVRCFQGPDGVIYFRNGRKSADGGLSITHQDTRDLEELLIKPERAYLVQGDSLYVAGNRARLIRPGEFEIDVWRSVDAMATVDAATARLRLPPGPTREPKPGEWFGVHVYRDIIDLGDGVWIMSMYGNFASDTLEPRDPSSAHEGTSMARSFVVRSTDRGATWDYLATIAAPSSGMPVGEGFVEPSLTRLEDGRLLCVMRTGHHFPLYASWSEDGGRTWSDPTYTGLDRGCDPCLIRLHDGRVAISWGRRYPEGWSRISREPDHERWDYPGAGYTSLAVSDDGGLTWNTQKIATGTGSCYSTIIEVAPDSLLCQVDQWVWRLALGR